MSNRFIGAQQSLNVLEEAVTLDVNGFADVGIVVAGTFVATLKVEVTMDGTNWAQYGADITAAATREITIPCKQVRVRVSAYTSGAAETGIGARQKND